MGPDILDVTVAVELKTCARGFEAEATAQNERGIRIRGVRSGFGKTRSEALLNLATVGGAVPVVFGRIKALAASLDASPFGSRFGMTREAFGELSRDEVRMRLTRAGVAGVAATPKNVSKKVLLDLVDAEELPDE